MTDSVTDTRSENIFKRLKNALAGLLLVIAAIELWNQGRALTAVGRLADKCRAESSLAWILRGVDAVVVFIGCGRFLGAALHACLGDPDARWSGRVGAAASLIALVTALSLTPTVIGVAWIAFRPVRGDLLLAAAAFYGLWRAHRRAWAVTMPSPAPT